MSLKGSHVAVFQGSFSFVILAKRQWESARRGSSGKAAESWDTDNGGARPSAIGTNIGCTFFV